MSGKDLQKCVLVWAARHCICKPPTVESLGYAIVFAGTYHGGRGRGHEAAGRRHVGCGATGGRSSAAAHAVGPARAVRCHIALLPRPERRGAPASAHAGDPSPTGEDAPHGPSSRQSELHGARGAAGGALLGGCHRLGPTQSRPPPLSSCGGARLLPPTRPPPRCKRRARRRQPGRWRRRGAPTIAGPGASDPSAPRNDSSSIGRAYGSHRAR
jgi:hypothetical protein